MKFILCSVLLLNLCFCFAQSANYMFSGDYFVVMVSPQKEGVIQTLNYGMDYNVGFAYQPLTFIDFGVFTNYQNAILKRTFLYEDYTMNMSIGKTTAEIKAFTLGFSSNLYFNKLFNFDQRANSFFNKMRFSLGVKGGIGFSSFQEQIAIQDFNLDYRNVQYNATNFNSRIEMAIGYPIFNNSFFSNVGFKFGYQFFKTCKFRNELGFFRFVLWSLFKHWKTLI